MIARKAFAACFVFFVLSVVWSAYSVPVVGVV